MLDLFEIARKNAPLLAQRLEDVKATKAAGDVALLERFANRVRQHGRVAINMRTSEFSDLLLRGRYYNIYEWSQELAAISGRPVNAIQREQLGTYFEKRMAFDGAFVDGKKFRYGTLNLGGAGPVRWGQFCAVLKAEFAESASRLAYVLGDSLNTYSDTSGNIDVSAVTRDAALHSSRQALAAIKHADEVFSTPAAEWPELLCSQFQFRYESERRAARGEFRPHAWIDDGWFGRAEFVLR